MSMAQMSHGIPVSQINSGHSSDEQLYNRLMVLSKQLDEEKAKNSKLSMKIKEYQIEKLTVDKYIRL